jgi:glycosyltransferase involved in cell wall biosynthesis
MTGAEGGKEGLGGVEGEGLRPPPPLRTVVVVPARDEERSVGAVVRGLRRAARGVAEVVVVDNGSRDGTAAAARDAGAAVVAEPRAGYGRACLAGLAYVARRPQPPDVVAFADADLSDDPADLEALLAPIRSGAADLVIGSRVLGARAGRVERGALAPHARWGNRLACALIRLRWGVRFTDLGPFRAVRYPALRALGMRDETFGWTVEMQVRAARTGLRCAEVPVGYRRRVGRSKITGTVAGSARAGTMILWTIGRYALAGREF